ncbi:unnamed protein product [Cladocopium goreaui]|uniref:CBM20 domain-containing protein n=1 Tax=Cladocopium goreaui TaxID=2562237 RepID=A0A9P1BT71_9DINO|nr:unnamed protein product [Cladocopium goreaui]
MEISVTQMLWRWASGEPSKGFLRLHVHCDSTRPGEDLGQDPVTGETYWPVWKLAEPLEVSVGQESLGSETLHYKYLLIRGTRRDKFKWEADGLGNHRRLRITEEMLRCGSWDDGLFGDLPGGKPCPPRQKKREEREEREAKPERDEEEICEACEVPKALSLPKHERIRQVGKGASAGTETFAVPLVAHYFQALCRKNKELIDRYALNRFATAGVSANPTFLCAASVSATLVAELPARSLWAGAVRSGNLWCALSARALQIAEIFDLAAAITA